jgi:ribonuclease P protein component
VGFAVSEAFAMTHRDHSSTCSPNHSSAGLASREVRIFPLDRPQSFLASLRGAGLQAQEFRLHHRSLLEAERQALCSQRLWPDTARSGEIIQCLAPTEPSMSRTSCLGGEVAWRACVLGFVLPKRVCKHAVRRNLIRRIMREGLRKHLLQASDWPLEPPVLVLKLTRKLPETFASARSLPLGRHLRLQVQSLLLQYSARMARQATASGEAPGPVVPESKS